MYSWISKCLYIKIHEIEFFLSAVLKMCFHQDNDGFKDVSALICFFP